MDRVGFDESLSSSLQTTLAVSGALALVAAVFLHRHQDLISSLFIRHIAVEEMIRNTNWQNLSIPAQVSATCCFRGFVS